MTLTSMNYVEARVVFCFAMIEKAEALFCFMALGSRASGKKERSRRGGGDSTDTLRKEGLR